MSTQDKIKIEEDYLKERITEIVKEAHKAGFGSGWGLPAYLYSDGTIESGGTMSDNNWQPDLVELIRVKSWSMSGDYNFEGEYSGEIEEDRAGIDWDDMDFHEKAEERASYLVEEIKHRIQFEEIEGVEIS